MIGLLMSAEKSEKYSNFQIAVPLKSGAGFQVQKINCSVAEAEQLHGKWLQAFDVNVSPETRGGGSNTWTVLNCDGFVHVGSLSEVEIVDGKFRQRMKAKAA